MDATAPVLHSISLDRTALNVGSGETTLLVTAHFSDDVSGIFDGTNADGSGGAVVSISFVSPSGQLVSGMFDVEHSVSGGPPRRDLPGECHVPGGRGSRRMEGVEPQSQR